MYHVVFCSIIFILLGALFIGSMLQEIILTPISLVRHANNLKDLRCHVMQNRSPGFVPVGISLLRRPLGIVLCVFSAHLLHEHWMCALNCWLIRISYGCNISVMPPGMIERSNFYCHNWAFTFSVVWPWRISKTSMDCQCSSAPICGNYIFNPDFQLDLQSSSHFPGPVV
jgi:hypothetical protein